MKAFIIFILIATLIACSPVSLATKAISSLAGGDSSGVAVDTRIAKEANDSIVLGENSRTDIKASEVNIIEVVNNNTSLSLIIIAIIGWILPDPLKMYRWVRSYLAHRRKDK